MTAVVLGGVDIFGGSGSMLGVLLAFVLVAELRNGMQLANVGGATQDMVIGGLLVGAILAGNAVRAAKARCFRLRRAEARKEVNQKEGTEAVPVQAALNTREGGSGR